jgi:hypothetical protein
MLSKRNDVEDKLERSISAVSVGLEELESRFLNQDIAVPGAIPIQRERERENGSIPASDAVN